MSQEGGKQQFEIHCTSRGFHVYRELRKPRLGQILQVNQEIGNLHDPFTLFQIWRPIMVRFKQQKQTVHRCLVLAVLS